MASVCDSQYFILQLVPGETTQYFVWDKIGKSLVIRTYSSVPDFYRLDDGSIIDVIESGGAVFLVVKADDSIVYSLVPLFSTSGSGYNTLLSASVTGTTLTVVMYSVIAKETTTQTFTMQGLDDDSPANVITPCFNDYLITENTILTSWCDGFILNEVITDYLGNADLVQTANSVTCGYSAPAGPFRVSEEIEVEYKSCILSNPLFMVWKNTLGGWDYWLFQKNQVESTITDSLGVFIKDYTSIADVTNPEEERGKTARGRIVLGAEGLTTQQKNGIKGILLSNAVYILNQDGTVNRKVQLIPGTFITGETQANVHSIEFEINDVVINTIRN